MAFNTLLNKLALLISVIAITASATYAQASKWAYTRKITITYSGEEMLPKAVIKLEITKAYLDYAKAAAGGADLRFSSNPYLNGDGLSYWIEDWNGENGISTIWVKLPLLIKDKNEIFMHYGNASAKPVADGHATFLFFDDFEDNDFSDKWDNVSIGEVKESDGMLKLKESDGELGQITAKYQIADKVVIRAQYQREKGDQHWTQAGIGGWNHWLCFGDYTDIDGIGTNYLMLFPPESINSRKIAPGVKSNIAGIDDKWHKIEYWFDGKRLAGRQENVVVAWEQNPPPAYSSKLALRTLDNDSWDNFAFISVRPYIDPKQLQIDITAEKKN